MGAIEPFPSFQEQENASLKTKIELLSENVEQLRNMCTEERQALQEFYETGAKMVEQVLEQLKLQDQEQEQDPGVGHDPAKTPLENAYDVYLRIYGTLSEEHHLVYEGPSTLNMIAQIIAKSDKRGSEYDRASDYNLFCDEVKDFLGNHHPLLKSLEFPPVEEAQLYPDAHVNSGK